MSMRYTKYIFGLLAVLTASLVLSMWIAPAFPAGKYPTKPVTIIVPFGTGGSTDISMRRVQPFVTEQLGVPVIVQNKGGAGGRIGATAVYKAKPDGYTLIAHNLPTIILGQLIFNAPYDVNKFTQIYGWVMEPRVIAVLPDSPYKTLDDLVKASKEKQLTAALVGFGVTDHLQSVLLKNKVGLNHRGIPFGSGGKAVKALLGKNTDFALPAAISAKPHYDDKRIRVLAIHSEESFPGYEGIPTMKELGYEGMVLSVDRGLMGPPGMDEGIVQILSQAMEKAVNDPTYGKLTKRAKEPVKPMNRQQWKARIDEVYAQVEKLVPMIKADMEKKKK